MKPDLAQSAKELAFLLAETQKHACGFSGDAGEITYLFFAAELSIADISEICELPVNEVNKTISDFLTDLFSKSKRFQEFLSRPPATDERIDEIRIEQDTAIAELKESKAGSLIASCKTPDSLGSRVRDMVGTAIRIGMPAASTNFTPESVSKMGIAAKLCEDRLNYSHKTEVEHVPFIIELGEKLRLVRNRLTLSQKDLAEKAGINAYYVNELEEGKSKPRSEIVVKLAKALNVSVDFFSRGILADTDMLNLANIPIGKIRPENLTYRTSRDTTDWELYAPRLGDMKETLLEDIVKTEDWTITLTAENMACLARIISKLVTPVEKVEAIVALSTRAGIIAGALSAVFYEKKKSQKISIVIPTVVRGELVFADKSIQPGLNIMLLEEVVRTADDFLKTTDEIKNRKGKVVAAVGVLDLLQPEEQKRILDVLPMYKYVFFSHDIASVLKQNRK